MEQDDDKGGGVAPSAGRSLLQRAPRDLNIRWGGAMGERWDIAVSCTAKTRDEVMALIEILTRLSDSSEPAPVSSADAP